MHCGMRNVSYVPCASESENWGLTWTVTVHLPDPSPDMAAILVDIDGSSTNAVHVQVQVQILGFGTAPTTRGTANVRSRSTLDI